MKVSFALTSHQRIILNNTLKWLKPERSAAANTQKQHKMSKFKVIFRDFRGETMLIDLCDTEEQMQRMTVLQLKQKITETDDFYAAIGTKRKT